MQRLGLASLKHRSQLLCSCRRPHNRKGDFYSFNIIFNFFSFLSIYGGEHPPGIPAHSLQPCVLSISGWQDVSGALPHPLPLKSTAGLSFPLREKSSNLFLKCFLPEYLPFAKPKFQPRNLTTINEPFSCRPPWSAVGISSFESSSQLRPNQHLSKEGRKKYK